jgi:hypothetical protein
MFNILVAISTFLPLEIWQQCIRSVPWKSLATHLADIKNDLIRIKLLNIFMSFKSVQQSILEFNIGSIIKVGEQIDRDEYDLSYYYTSGLSQFYGNYTEILGDLKAYDICYLKLHTKDVELLDKYVSDLHIVETFKTKRHELETMLKNNNYVDYSDGRQLKIGARQLLCDLIIENEYNIGLSESKLYIPQKAIDYDKKRQNKTKKQIKIQKIKQIKTKLIVNTNNERKRKTRVHCKYINRQDQ